MQVGWGIDHLVIGREEFVSLRDRGGSFDRPGHRQPAVWRRCLVALCLAHSSRLAHRSVIPHTRGV